MVTPEVPPPQTWNRRFQYGNDGEVVDFKTDFLTMNFPFNRLVLLVTAFLCCLRVEAGATDCDPGLPVDQTNDLSYQPRKDRCEGLYIQQVAGETLRIAGMAISSPDFMPNKDKPLSIRWPHFAVGQIQLRAISLRSTLYYRMDAVRPEASSPFEWFTDVLTNPAIRLSRSEIGILGWVNYILPSHEPVQLFVPITLEQHPSQSASQVSKPDSYELVILPAFQLTELYFTLEPVNARGFGSPIRNEEKIGGYYSPDEPIFIRIPFTDLTNSQVYYFSVAAVVKDNGSTNLDGYFINLIAPDGSH
jgi:hypothetical protein